ncbi:chitobiase/beta-hexosaminidase C-terminal domain-containing protein [Prevotella sp.]|uniref:chitobiase/beta-hexosaminidase C-terminal domain-containing protein n=1 Tax=Prevotella sp. TaxID=59823 RepID=UPI00307BF212
MKYTNSNKPIYIKSITVTYKEAPSKALTSLAISGTPTKTKYNDGEEFDPTGLVVTGTYDDNSTATITDGITWTKNPATLAVGTTSCSVTATVNGVTSPAYEVTGLTVVKSISLSIAPATSTVVKAPVTITLTATEGAAVYYTTNGDEPTTSSTKYNAPFEVTKSGTTVKAIAVAEGAEDVKAEATYTIKPDQPVFSEESKTFKDAFDVTLSLPESADATSEIHYAIGATATAESPVYSGPVNISAENDGGNVILHAVVVDQYGNVGKEKYCTYTKSTAIVFDFTADPNVWGITPDGNNSKPGDNVIAGKELKVDGVVMTATNGSSNVTCLYKNTKNSVNLRVYTGGSITFTAPEGYNLSNITFDFDNDGTFSTDVKTWKTPKWTGNAHTVKFTCTNSIQVNTATIKLVVATPVTPEVTSGTINFIAHDAEGYRYATFSSDKDVVFTEDVVVSGVSITNGKLSVDDFTSSSYDVTDTEKGNVKGYYVPAKTGVLVNCLAETATYYFPKTEQTVTLPANQLKPAPADGRAFTAETGYKYYKLAYDNYTAQTGLGFYWGAENAGAFKVKPGTAYLAVPTSEANNAKGFAFDGETTGVENVNVAVNQNKTIYNLNGQRVSNMSQAGLYIVNGKKVVIRK